MLFFVFRATVRLSASLPESVLLEKRENQACCGLQAGVPCFQQALHCLPAICKQTSAFCLCPIEANEELTLYLNGVIESQIKLYKLQYKEEAGGHLQVKST